MQYGPDLSIRYYLSENPGNDNQSNSMVYRSIHDCQNNLYVKPFHNVPFYTLPDPHLNAVPILLRLPKRKNGKSSVSGNGEPSERERESMEMEKREEITLKAFSCCSGGD